CRGLYVKGTWAATYATGVRGPAEKRFLLPRKDLHRERRSMGHPRRGRKFPAPRADLTSFAPGGARSAARFSVPGLLGLGREVLDELRQDPVRALRVAEGGVAVPAPEARLLVEDGHALG